MPDVDLKNEPVGASAEEFPLHGYACSEPIPGLDTLSDTELEELNGLLPWKAFVADGRGRRFGRPASATKRNLPGIIPDPRIVELDRRFGLTHKTVLELGCFEGIHTIALARLAKLVIACDSRISNVAKTAVRCAMFQMKPTLFVWDVEKPMPAGQKIGCDVLHHVGVLYHLVDPIAHLKMLLPHVRQGLLIDTHYSSEADAKDVYSASGREYHVRRYREGGLADPFSGMYLFARWLLLPDLVNFLREQGFAKVDITNDRQERHGLRVAIYAER